MTNSLLNNLVAYWGLDEAAGANDALDKHSGGRTLTQHASPGSSTGKVYAGARTFDGSADYFSRASETALQGGDNDLTWAAWVYLTATGTQIIACKFASTEEYILYYDSSAFVLEVSSNGSTNSKARATNFGSASINTWYFVTAWHDATNNVIGISVNNGTPNTAAYSSGIYSGTNDFFVGAAYDGSVFGQLSGRIGPVCMWKSVAGGGGVLTSDQRTALYNAGAGLTYAAFDDGTEAATVIAPWLRPRQHRYVIDSWR